MNRRVPAAPAATASLVVGALAGFDAKPRSRTGNPDVTVTDFARNQVPDPPRSDEASSRAARLTGSPSFVQLGALS